MARLRSIASVCWLCAGVHAAMLAIPVGASAQFNAFFLDGGYSAARQLAIDTLATDAYLVYAGTFGDLDISQFTGVPIRLNFYIDSVPRSGLVPAKLPGQAEAWGYVFYSPLTRQSVNLIVVSIPFIGMRAQGVPVPLPIPTGLIDSLVLTEPGNRSDTLIARLKRDAVFAQYHARYPRLQPEFVSIGKSAAAGIVPPVGFPTGAIWTVNFAGNRDTSSLLCLVASAGGETFCQPYGVSSVDPESSASGDVALRALPNPSTGTLRIILDLPPHARSGELSMSLYSVSGALVADLAPSLARNALRYAELDASALPAGIYFCRAAGTHWSSTLPITIGSR